jgi:hypothetical protein
MIALLFAAVSAQSTTPLNSTLTPACQTAVNGASPALERACSTGVAPLISQSNPLNGITNSISDSTLASFCSATCQSAVGSFQSAVAPQCANNAIFQGSDVTANGLAASYSAESDIFCVQDSGKYCLPVLYSALVASGLNPANTQTIANAFIKFASNPALACTPCASAVLSKVQKNIATFQQYASIINAEVAQIQSTCSTQQTKNHASTAGLGIGAIVAAVLLQ